MTNNRVNGITNDNIFSFTNGIANDTAISIFNSTANNIAIGFTVVGLDNQ